MSWYSQRKEHYYYAELCTNSKSILAYKDLTYAQLKSVAKSYHNTLVKHELNHTFIFGNMKNIKQLGNLGTAIIKQAKPYPADIESLIINQSAWYLEHGEDDN